MHMRLITLLSAVALLISGASYAQDHDWSWTLTPYGWLGSIDLLVAYKHLDVDYENGDFVYDAATSGLAIGVAFRF